MLRTSLLSVFIAIMVGSGCGTPPELSEPMDGSCDFGTSTARKECGPQASLVASPSNAQEDSPAPDSSLAKAYDIRCFPGDAYSADTQAMDVTLGLNGYVIEDFEDGELVPGLSFQLVNESAHPYSSLGVYDKTWSSLSNLNPANNSWHDNTWDGQMAVVNAPDNIPQWNTFPNTFTQAMTFHIEGGTSSFGVGLANFQSERDQHWLVINGEVVAHIEQLPCYGTGISSRNGYLRIDAEPGETIFSVGFWVETPGNDGLVFDHLAFQPTHESGWVPTGSLALDRLLHAATRLEDGRVLVTGGFNRTSELYDPATGTWTRTGDTLASHRGHTLTRLTDGRVLIAGGGQCPKTGATSEVYEPASGVWAPTGSMVTYRSEHAAALLPDGRVLIMGGTDSSGQVLSSAELYDPTTGTWASTGNMGMARHHFTATLLPDGQVLVAGGNNDSSNPLDSAELYDPTTGRWVATASMGAPRSYHTATLLGSGKVLVTGGGSDTVFSASAELYDPELGAWTPTHPMSSPRRYHTATLLLSGKVLVAGGYHESTGILTAAELYDPTREHWSTTDSMNVDRYSHTATLLEDGRVLAVGGVSNHGQDSSELYTLHESEVPPNACSPHDVTTDRAIATPVTVGPCAETYLSDLCPAWENNVHHCVTFDRVYWQPDIVVDGVRYAKGISMHPPALEQAPQTSCRFHDGAQPYFPGRGRAAWDLAGRFDRFLATIALSELGGRDFYGAFAVFRIYVDGLLRYESPVVGADTPPIGVVVEVAGAQTLVLETDALNNSNWGDHAVWLNARLRRTCP